MSWCPISKSCSLGSLCCIGPSLTKQHHQKTKSCQSFFKSRQDNLRISGNFYFSKGIWLAGQGSLSQHLAELRQIR